MNLAVCVPISWDYVPTPFLISFTQLFRPGQLKAIRALGVEKYFHLFNRAFPLDHNRNQLVAKSLELDADWVLFLDADMTFPAGMAPGLLRSAIESKAAIVSACYFKKQPPHACVSSLKKFVDDPQLLTPIDPCKDREGEEEKGLVECDVIGMGAALIHARVFEEVPRPWFEYEAYAGTGEMTVTEDVPFCRKAKEAGFTILTDTAMVCGHIRQIEVDQSNWIGFRDKVAENDREAVPAGEGL